MDMFFRCTVADCSSVTPDDDAAEARWIPISELNPADFGLTSISKAVARFVEMKSENG